MGCTVKPGRGVSNFGGSLLKDRVDEAVNDASTLPGSPFIDLDSMVTDRSSSKTPDSTSTRPVAAQATNQLESQGRVPSRHSSTRLGPQSTDANNCRPGTLNPHLMFGNGTHEEFSGCSSTEFEVEHNMQFIRQVPTANVEGLAVQGQPALPQRGSKVPHPNDHDVEGKDLVEATAGFSSSTAALMAKAPSRTSLSQRADAILKNVT
ncbi:hypothetical protein CEUSTIGMA_g9158.t1 [Chlamydomonas eustigma]|uniref:Uncharacterized protein n=1 Tax=Chlamydomonas eustigma TaxID=1157962 RepID=A0A250XG15_9CHLO|nr:hypothetical protein CEUSTIGMA_g9158.t1 [Chlamydomonas eustigma]|eukprot:GAX81730.1 hypothetical protein CEUSTIGMA_g9158.t1 [Chlamydomonas eustigma]